MSSGHKGHGHGIADDNSSDAVDYGMVIKVGVATLLLFAVSIAWAGKLWRDGIKQTQAKTGVAADFDRTRTEIGIVDQVPFSVDKRLPRWKHDRKVELESYGWVDKSKGVVRIPIEAAMEQVASGAMPAGAPR